MVRHVWLLDIMHNSSFVLYILVPKSMSCKEDIRKIFRILFVVAATTSFVIFFGIPSIKKYFEKRTIFSEEYLEYERSDDPNILIQHIRFDQATSGIHSLAKPIFKCFNDNGKDYNKNVICIENVTFSKKEYINTNHARGMFFFI